MRPERPAGALLIIGGMLQALDVVGYLTTGGTGPWIIGGLAVGTVAVILRDNSPQRGRRGLLAALAVAAFVVAALAALALAVSGACEGAGGCMH